MMCVISAGYNESYDTIVLLEELSLTFSGTGEVP